MTPKIENVAFVSIAKIEGALMNDELVLEAVAHRGGLTGRRKIDRWPVMLGPSCAVSTLTNRAIPNLSLAYLTRTFPLRGVLDYYTRPSSDHNRLSTIWVSELRDAGR
jgi:hypothetical protein